jgi:hypothetical protein
MSSSFYGQQFGFLTGGIFDFENRLFIEENNKAAAKGFSPFRYLYREGEISIEASFYQGKS